jgi:hypothetical protein
MLQFLSANENMPFVVALGLVIGLAILELIGLLVGFAFSHVVDNLIDVDVDADVDVPDGGFHLIEWFGFGKTPALVVLILWLSYFGGIGVLLQVLSLRATGALWNPWPAAGVALVATIPLVRISSGLFAKYVFREETTAVSEDTFVGKVATITLGTAEKGRPTQARLTDQHGQTHYVLVEPLGSGDSHSAGTEVLLVDRQGHIFLTVANTVEALERYSDPTLDTVDLRGT